MKNSGPGARCRFDRVKHGKLKLDKVIIKIMKCTTCAKRCAVGKAGGYSETSAVSRGPQLRCSWDARVGLGGRWDPSREK